LPIPYIMDGNHRYRAAKYLRFETLHCQYGGLVGLLDYLTGVSDEVDWD